ncbi:MAG: hypothetical protein IAF08_13565, partial [Rhizobacter sp.]|nr:hypothetical protein [Chlorobiales bacterium]
MIQTFYHCKVCTAFALLSLLIVSPPLSAQTRGRHEPIGVEKSIKADFQLGALELTVKPHHHGNLFDYIYTSGDSTDLSCNYSVDTDGEANLELMTSSTGQNERRKVRISFNSFFSKDKETEKPRVMELSLSDSLPMELSLSLGAAAATLDLSGLKLSAFSLSSGASNNAVRFTKPNPVQMKTMEISTGASKLEMTGLGYANFDTMELSGGATNVVLDFGGNIRRQVKAEISIGAGSVRILVPKDLAVRINAS